MFSLRSLTSLAGQATRYATDQAELLKIDTVLMPGLHFAIGKALLSRPTLPAELSLIRDTVRELEAEHDRLTAPQPDVAGQDISERTKRLVSQASRVASSTSLSAKIRATYIEAGRTAVAQYGEKAVPKAILDEYRSALERRELLSSGQLRTPSARASTDDQQPKSIRANNKVRRRSTLGKRVVLGTLAAAGVSVLVAAAIQSEKPWLRILKGDSSAGRSRSGGVAAPAPPQALPSSSKDAEGSSSFLSAQHESAAQLLFPTELKRPSGSLKACASAVIDGGRLLTVVDEGRTEVTCILRESDGSTVASHRVSGDLVADAGFGPIVPCPPSGAALLLRRGRSYVCVMVANNGVPAWETESLDRVDDMVPLGGGAVLIAASLIISDTGEKSPFGTLYRWNSQGQRSWGHDGGGPFAGSTPGAGPERFEQTKSQFMVSTDGVAAATVTYGPPRESPRLAVSIDTEGNVVGFAPRGSRRLESGETRNQNMLRAVLRDGRLITQDGYDKDEIVVFGREGQEVLRKRMGVCLQARSCRDSDDALLALAAGVDTRIVRMRPDGSEVWSTSLLDSIPNPPKDELRAFVSDTLIELPGGGVLWTCRRCAVVLNKAGGVVACGVVRSGGGRAEVSTDGKVLWPCHDGTVLVGEISKWPAK
jgi:hypothetical protein